MTETQAAMAQVQSATVEEIFEALAMHFNDGVTSNNEAAVCATMRSMLIIPWFDLA